jgi:hypothetical protein
MRHRSRALAAWIALVTLLFAQLAVAAYACPRFTAPEAVAATPDCDEPMNANLCESHCDYGSTSLDSKSKVPGADVAPVSVRVELSFALPPLRPSAPSPAGVATGPPVTRFTVLRI